MKIYFFLVFSLFIFISGFAQIPEDAIAIGDEGLNDYYQNNEHIPVVKGKILNLPENEMRNLKINYIMVTPFSQLQTEKNCRPNPDGTFKLELDYALPYQQIWFRVGKIFYAGIYAHKDLFIELDVAKFGPEGEREFNGDGVRYLGSDGELNNYLNNHVLFENSENPTAYMSLFFLFTSKEFHHDAFINEFDSIFTTLYETDSEYIQQNPSEYSWLIINDRKSDYYGYLANRLQGKPVSSEMYDRIKNHKVYLVSNNGMLYNRHLYDFVLCDIEKDPPADYALNAIKTLDSIFPQSKSDLLKLHIASKVPETRKILIDEVLKNIKTDWCRNIIQLEYESDLAKSEVIEEILNKSSTSGDVQLGQFIAETPFGAKLYKIDSMDYQILLSNLKTAHENKALIIDFWATWCLPCLRELPRSKNLQNETKELPVAFVYLCTSRDSDIEKWQAKITELEIGGTHVFVDNEIESQLMALFSVSGYPSYVFIDQNGDYKAGTISNMSHFDKAKLTELLK